MFTLLTTYHKTFPLFIRKVKHSSFQAPKKLGAHIIIITITSGSKRIRKKRTSFRTLLPEQFCGTLNDLTVFSRQYVLCACYGKIMLKYGKFSTKNIVIQDVYKIQSMFNLYLTDPKLSN